MEVGRGERCRRRSSFSRRWSKSIRAFVRCLNARHFHFCPTLTVRDINAQYRARRTAQQMPWKGANSSQFDLPFSVARAAAAAADRRFFHACSPFFISISTYLLRSVPRRRAALGARLCALERDDASDAWNNWRFGRERKREGKEGGELKRIAKIAVASRSRERDWHGLCWISRDLFFQSFCAVTLLTSLSLVGRKKKRRRTSAGSAGAWTKMLRRRRRTTTAIFETPHPSSSPS